jgi:hypothetical protein
LARRGPAAPDDGAAKLNLTFADDADTHLRDRVDE